MNGYSEHSEVGVESVKRLQTEHSTRTAADTDLQAFFCHA
jgi:hypothetical protein